MELNEISGEINIEDKHVSFNSILLNDRDVFGNGETSMPCFQMQLTSEENDSFFGVIDLTLNDAIILKNNINIFLDKIKCGIEPQFISNEFSKNITVKK